MASCWAALSVSPRCPRGSEVSAGFLEDRRHGGSKGAIRALEVRREHGVLVGFHLRNTLGEVFVWEFIQAEPLPVGCEIMGGTYVCLDFPKGILMVAKTGKVEGGEGVETSVQFVNASVVMGSLALLAMDVGPGKGQGCGANFGEEVIKPEDEGRWGRIRVPRCEKKLLDLGLKEGKEDGISYGDKGGLADAMTWFDEARVGEGR